MELYLGNGELGNINKKIVYNYVRRENAEDVGGLNFKFQFPAI